MVAYGTHAAQRSGRPDKVITKTKLYGNVKLELIMGLKKLVLMSKQTTFIVCLSWLFALLFPQTEDSLAFQNAGLLIPRATWKGTGGLAKVLMFPVNSENDIQANVRYNRNEFLPLPDKPKTTRTPGSANAANDLTVRKDSSQNPVVQLAEPKWYFCIVRHTLANAHFWLFMG